MYAVMLRDLRTRFFNHALGFLVVPLFPIMHLLALLILYNVLSRDAPYGQDINLFSATGLLPTLTFIYMSRFMSVSLISNKPMLAFPVVRLLDIVIARAGLEFLGAVIAAVAILTLLFVLGANPVPHDLLGAITAILLVAILAIGFGIIASILTLAAEFFATVWGLSMILVYLGSGALFVVAHLPQDLAYYLSFNPILQAVEWVRVSFYPGYPDQYLNKTYLAAWAFGSLFLGLLSEKMLRQRLLIGI